MGHVGFARSLQRPVFNQVVVELVNTPSAVGYAHRGGAERLACSSRAHLTTRETAYLNKRDAGYEVLASRKAIVEKVAGR